VSNAGNFEKGNYMIFSQNNLATAAHYQTQAYDCHTAAPSLRANDLVWVFVPICTGIISLRVQASA